METNNPKPQCVFVFGGPGSGKGTYCSMLANELNYIHISMGEILRKERNSETVDGKLLNEHMKVFEVTGKFIPVEIPVKYLLKEIQSYSYDKDRIFLIEGYLRTTTDYDYWVSNVSNYLNPKFVLCLECSRETMKSRMLNRNRKDNYDKIADVRISNFFDLAMPVVDLFDKLDSVIKVDTDNSQIEETYNAIKEIFKQKLNIDI